jgi:hypothetical protein
VPDLEDLRRTWSRVEPMDDFRPGDRIWWIYLRNAAIEAASRNNLPGLQDVCDQLKAFPENLPNERGRWLALRDEVARVLAEYG